MMKPLYTLLLAMVCGYLAASCTATSEDERTEVVIYAASSLTDAFADLETAFEDIHSDIDVTLNFAGSQILRTQIEAGAPADVFVSADPTHVDVLVGSQQVLQRQVLTRNELVAIVPRDANPSIRDLNDLMAVERIVVGTNTVPVGRYTRSFFADARSVIGDTFVDELESRIVSHESNVRLARTKVELGEADAAFVYRTDALASDRVRIVELPPELQTLAEYEMGVLVEANEEAHLFAQFALSEEGQAILRSHGFRELAE